MVAASELPIDTGASALLMAEEICGLDAVVVSASYSGDNASCGIYSNGDAMFNALVGSRTYNAAIQDVDHVQVGDTLTMQFVFSSDECPEYSNSVYNDAVGVRINASPVSLAVGDENTSVGDVNGFGYNSPSARRTLRGNQVRVLGLERIAA